MGRRGAWGLGVWEGDAKEVESLHEDSFGYKVIVKGALNWHKQKGHMWALVTERAGVGLVSDVA